MNGKQFRPGSVLALFNIKSNFDKVCDIVNNESMMNGGSGGFDSGFELFLCFGRKVWGGRKHD